MISLIYINTANADNMYIREYPDSLGQKNHNRKISNIHKDFKLYQFFMYNLLYQNFPMLIF